MPVICDNTRLIYCPSSNHDIVCLPSILTVVEAGLDVNLEWRGPATGVVTVPTLME